MLIFRISLLFVLMYFSTVAHSKAQQVYSLQEVIDVAQGASIRALIAKNTRQNRFWQYRTYLSNFKPQLLLDGSLPNFSRAILQNRNDDGSIGFINVSNLNTDLGLSLRQTVAATGAEIFVSSTLARLQNFGDFGGLTQYSSNLIQVGLIQPLFNFNASKWERRIEPIRYEESIKKYSEDIEGIAVEATSLFFNLLDAQTNLEIAQNNRANNDTIFQIGQKRYELGTITENDLLQLQLNVLNASQQVSQARLSIETSTLALKAFLGNPEELINFQLTLPTLIPDIQINLEQAQEQARNNREQFIRFQRQQLEADREVAKAKGESGLNVNIFASAGFTARGEALPEAYTNLQDQQTVQVGFQVPLLDWGRQKARRQTALANQELINSTIQQETLNLEQEIYLKVKQFDLLRERLLIEKETEQISQKRYEIAQKRYIGNSISITDFNIALQEKDQAKRQYLTTLREFWQVYYQIRQQTMYNFEKGTVIQY